MGSIHVYPLRSHKSLQVNFDLLIKDESTQHVDDVLFHRHMGEQAALLDDIAHQAGKLGHLDPVDGGAIDENLAFVNGVELVERFQQGRFPASAGTDQDKKLVVLDGQTDVHQYRFSAV